MCVSGVVAQGSLQVNALSEEVVTRATYQADSVLSQLSIKQQLAQLLLLPDTQVDAQRSSLIKYGLGAILTTDSGDIAWPMTLHKIPVLRGAYWQLFPDKRKQGTILLRSVRDTAFVRHFARLQALRFHKRGTSLLYMKGQNTLSFSQDSTFHAYAEGLADLGIILQPQLRSQEDADDENRGLFFYTHDVLQGMIYLRKKLSTDERERKVRTVLIYKYLHKHIRKQYETTGISLGLERQLLLPQTLTLLNCQSQTIPIQRLDALEMAWIPLHSPTDTPWRRMSDYAEVDTYTEANASQTALRPYNTVLLTLEEEQEIDHVLHMRRDSLIEQLLTLDKKVIVMCFGVNTLRKYSLLQRVDGLIFSPSTYTEAYDFSVQALFGAIDLHGQLPFSAHDYLPGEGLEVQSNGTLSFVAPEVLGIDSEELYRKVEEILWEGLEQRAFPGCQVLAAKHGQVFFYENYGYHTYSQDRAVSASSIYDLASLTKVMGATTALMKLYEEEKFSLKATLSDYFPKWRKTEAGTLVFKNILAHHTGLPSWIPYYKEMFKKNGKWKHTFLSHRPSRKYSMGLTDGMYARRNFRKKIYEMIAKTTLGKKEYVYSGLIFYLIPELIEKLATVSYEKYLAHYFFDPMGAYSIKFNPLTYFSLQDIVPTEEDDFFRHALLHGVVHDEGAALMGGVSGNAGLFGRAIDVAKVFQMYLQKGYYGGHQYVDPETVDTFTHCHFCDEENRRGLGFDKPPILYTEGESSVAAQASAKSFGHTGFTGVIAWADPESELLFVFLCNRVHPTRNNTQIYELNLRPRLHQIFYELTNQNFNFFNFNIKN